MVYYLEPVHQRALYWYPIYWEGTNTHKLNLKIICSSTCVATQLAWKCPPPWKPCHQFLEDFAMCLQLAGQLQQWLHRSSVCMIDVGALLIAHTKAECAQDKSVVVRLLNDRSHLITSQEFKQHQVAQLKDSFPKVIFSRMKFSLWAYDSVPDCPQPGNYIINIQKHLYGRWALQPLNWQCPNFHILCRRGMHLRRNVTWSNGPELALLFGVTMWIPCFSHW